VLLWVADGKTNAEIGLIVIQKLGVENRTAAARVAFDALGTTRR
jgi:DNA-binding CsgD family transcriptional regulator